MPIYEYLCESCGRRFELIRRASEAELDLECPDCQSRRVERQISAFSAGGCARTPGGGFS